ncbi:MAG: helix-turn-helix transcriptional regulator [Pseudomonadota bacterium]
MEGLPQKIKKARNLKKMTLEELANAVGSSKSYMWQLETDSKIKPSVELIAKIADALNVTVDYLIDQGMNEMDEDQEALVFFRGYKDLDDASKEMIKQQMKLLKKIQKDRDEGLKFI